MQMQRPNTMQRKYDAAPKQEQKRIVETSSQTELNNANFSI